MSHVLHEYSNSVGGYADIKGVGRIPLKLADFKEKPIKDNTYQDTAGRTLEDGIAEEDVKDDPIVKKAMGDGSVLPVFQKTQLKAGDTVSIMRQTYTPTIGYFTGKELYPGAPAFEVPTNPNNKGDSGAPASQGKIVVGLLGLTNNSTGKNFSAIYTERP